MRLAEINFVALILNFNKFQDLTSAGHPLLEKLRCFRCCYLAKKAAALPLIATQIKKVAPLPLLACKTAAAVASLKKINSTKNNGIQIRYLIVKFQLCLRKLIIQAFLDIGSGYNRH